MADRRRVLPGSPPESFFDDRTRRDCGTCHGRVLELLSDGGGHSHVRRQQQDAAEAPARVLR